MLAAAAGHAEVVSLLMRLGKADQSGADDFGRTAFHFGCQVRPST